MSGLKNSLNPAGTNEGFGVIDKTFQKFSDGKWGDLDNVRNRLESITPHTPFSCFFGIRNFKSTEHLFKRAVTEKFVDLFPKCIVSSEENTNKQTVDDIAELFQTCKYAEKFVTEVRENYIRYGVEQQPK